MQPLTIEQWTWLWQQAKDDTAARDWLFGLIADLGMDVQHDTVVKPA